MKDTIIYVLGSDTQLSGTVSVTNNTTSISTTSNLTSQLTDGSVIKIDSYVMSVKAVTSGTITLYSPYEGTTGSGKTIYKLTGYELSAVNMLQPSFTFSNTVEEGINATYPITVTPTGDTTPIMTIGGDMFMNANQRLVDHYGVQKKPNDMSLSWFFVNNRKSKFIIYPYKLALNNPITVSDSTRNYFVGVLNSLQFAPSVQYMGDMVGDVTSYNVTFKLTGE